MESSRQKHFPPAFEAQGMCKGCLNALGLLGQGCKPHLDLHVQQVVPEALSSMHVLGGTSSYSRWDSAHLDGTSCPHLVRHKDKQLDQTI